MTERRYNEAEVAAIFERATEVPTAGSAAASTSEGMTLAQLHEIGAEVGITAESITLAASVVDQPTSVAQRKFLGLPLGAARTVQLDRPLTDVEWERLVGELREMFNAAGKVTSHGALRTWTNGNLQVLLEPTAPGYRLRLRTERRDAAARMILGLSGMFGGAAALTAAALQVATGDGGLIAALSVTMLAGAAIVAGTVIQVRGWARTRQQQFDAIAARVALTTKSLPPGSEQ